jgi:hypothetical protein
MKKQALSFFFFIMLNLAMAREGSSFNFKNGAGIESGAAKNRINLRQKDDDTILIGELSVAKPVVYSDDPDPQRINTPADWYKITNSYNNECSTGYIWNIPLNLLSVEHKDRAGPLDIQCYGITSCDKKTGLHMDVRVLHDGTGITGLQCHFTTEEADANRKWDCSVALSIYGDIGIPEINRLIALKFQYQLPKYCSEEIIMIPGSSGLLIAGKIITHTSSFGFPLAYCLS